MTKVAANLLCAWVSWMHGQTWPNACNFIKNALYSSPETTSKSPVAWSYLSLSSSHVLSDPFDVPSYGVG